MNRQNVLIAAIILTFLLFTGFIHKFGKQEVELPAPPAAAPAEKKPSRTPAQVRGYPLSLESGDVRLVLTDFTRTLKPDRRCEALVCREFVKLINEAGSSIDMAVFGWDEVPVITRALEAALARGVQIRMVCDTTDFYADTPKLAELIKNSVKDDAQNVLMHNKFAVFDRQKALTGSMNFSSTGLSGFNANNVIVINSQEAAQRFTDEFEQMYSGKFHTAKASPQRDSSERHSEGLVPEESRPQNDIQVYFSPQDRVITDHIVPLVSSARKYIYLPVFIITHKALSRALIDAKARGVDVKLITDATNPFGPGSAVKTLREAGIPVKIENYAGKMHSKTILIDDKYLVIGSMNFSNSGENKNDENVVILKDSVICRYYRGYFEYLWKKIPDKYLRLHPRAESKYSIGSCYDGIDNNFDSKKDSADEGCR